MAHTAELKLSGLEAKHWSEMCSHIRKAARRRIEDVDVMHTKHNDDIRIKCARAMYFSIKLNKDQEPIMLHACANGCPNRKPNSIMMQQCVCICALIVIAVV